ncbi:MAG: hypothetical protein QM784_03635 [Polyangiaceae bacterium]
MPRTWMIALFVTFCVSDVAAAATAEPDVPLSGDPRREAPPPSAFEACDGKAKGDACSVKLAELELQGSCEVAPPSSKDSRLACRPSGPSPEAPRE